MESNYFVALGLGILFGFALNKGGLTRYGNIVGVFRFTNLTVIKFMMTALCVASIGLYTMRQLGVITLPAAPATYILGNLLGGLIFGAGMAWAGYCPGTVAAGAGEGKLDYLIPGGLGLLTGALLYGITYPQFMPAVLKVANLGNIVLPDLLNVNPFLFVGVFVVFVLILFYFLENGLKRADRLEE